MAVVLGLDPCLFLKEEHTIEGDNKYQIVSELFSFMELAQSQNIKYLYNGYFDQYLPSGIVNVMKDALDEMAYMAFMNVSPLEYFEHFHGYDTENIDELGCSFEVPLQGYVADVFRKLYETYHHGIVISDRCSDIQIGEHTYHFVKDIVDNAELSIEMLPQVTNYDDFEAYFPLYHWFYGREEYPIILSNTFVNEIGKVDDEQLLRILTSLIRGVYFPDYLKREHKYSIEGHPDSDIKTMKINEKTTMLCRIHSVGVTERSGGVNRICYANTTEKGQRYVIVFHYKEDHCDKLNHEETIYAPSIIQSEDAFTLTNGTFFAIKVKWR